MPQPNNPCSYEFPQKLLNHQSSLPSGSNGWRIMLKPSVLPRTQDDLWMQTEAIEGVGKEVNILCILSRQVQRISTKFFCIFLYNLLFQPCAVHAVCVTAWHETLQIHWGHRWNRQLGYEPWVRFDTKKRISSKLYKDIEETTELLSYKQPFHHEDLGDSPFWNIHLLVDCQICFTNQTRTWHDSETCTCC